MIKQLLKVAVGGGMLFVMAGCGSTSDEEGVGNARLAQIQWSTGHDWTRYTFTFEDSHVLANVLVMQNTVGGFSANTEYWYVNTSNLQYLGAQDFIASHSDGDSTPPSLSGSQTFTQAANQTWDTFTTDPVSGGYLYDSSNVHLRIKTGSGVVTQLTWYQTLGRYVSADNVTPSGTFAISSGSVSIPTDDVGYDIDASIN